MKGIAEHGPPKAGPHPVTSGPQQKILAHIKNSRDLLCRTLGVEDDPGKSQHLCPFHDDQNPSMSIHQTDKGHWRWKCHACDKGGTTIDALMLRDSITAAEAIHRLTDGQAEGAEPATSTTPPPDEESRKQTVVINTDGPSEWQQPDKRIVATYPYHDDEGNLLYQVVRYDPKDFRQRRPDGNGGWVWNLNGTPRVLFRLPEIFKANPDDLVFIVEGEKDADNLRAIGILATTCPQGAGKWSKLSDDSALHGRRVVILPDADEAGRKHAEDVAARLHGKAASVRVLDLKPAFSGFAGKDVSDLLATDGPLAGIKPEEARQRLIEAVEAAPEWVPAENPEATPKVDSLFDGRTFIPLRLARALKTGRTLHFGFNPDKGDGSLMEFDGSVWKPATALPRAAQAILGEHAREARIREAVAFLERDVPATPWGCWDALPDKFVACRNGLADLDTGGVKPHDPSCLLRSCLPWNYRPGAQSAALDEALDAMFPDPNVRDVALMLAGYCLTPCKKSKAFAFLHGAGNSGKTTFIYWLRGLVGPDAYSAASPQDLTENRFASAALEGKLLNAPDELDALGLKSIEKLKALTGGAGTYHVEHKGQDPYEARMTATLVFACNELPTGAGDADEAYYKRLLIVPFSGSFEGGDPAVRDEWPSSPDVMEALLAKAVEGLKQLRSNGWKFPRPGAMAKELDAYRACNDTLAAFVDLRCVLQPEAKVARAQLYEAYAEFCQTEGVGVPSRKDTFARIRKRWKVTEPKLNGEFFFKGIGLASADDDGGSEANQGATRGQQRGNKNGSEFDHDSCLGGVQGQKGQSNGTLKEIHKNPEGDPGASRGQKGHDPQLLKRFSKGGKEEDVKGKETVSQGVAPSCPLCPQGELEGSEDEAGDAAQQLLARLGYE